MKDINKNELIAKLDTFQQERARSNTEIWTTDYIEEIADHIMPEFKPEVGKLYYFSDHPEGERVENPPIYKFNGMSSAGDYLNKFNTPWIYCWPITPEEIGK